MNGKIICSCVKNRQRKREGIGLKEAFDQFIGPLLKKNKFLKMP